MTKFLVVSWDGTVTVRSWWDAEELIQAQGSSAESTVFKLELIYRRVPLRVKANIMCCQCNVTRLQQTQCLTWEMLTGSTIHW